MKDTPRNLLVGFATLGAVAGFVVLLLLFGELDAIVHPRYAITLKTDHATGLRRGSGIELNGVPVGVIHEVTVQAPAAYPVRVTMFIDEGVGIPIDATPYATGSLLGGAAVLEIDAPTDPSTPILPADGTATLTAPIRYRMVEQIRSELDERTAPVLEAVNRFNELSDRISSLSTTYEEFGRRMSSLVEAQTPEELAAGATPNIHTTIGTANEVLAETRDAVALANDWLGDEPLRTDARAVVRKASALMDQASAAMTKFTEVAGNVEADTHAVAQRLLPVADEAARTIEEIRRMTRLATEGHGTLALMLSDPGLYESLNDAATRLEKVLREVQLLVEKVKKEGLDLGL